MGGVHFYQGVRVYNQPEYYLLFDHFISSPGTTVRWRGRRSGVHGLTYVRPWTEAAGSTVVDTRYVFSEEERRICLSLATVIAVAMTN